jgi:4-amino-4-deoxy-L-arabinose transferase-like glycosyltransferase
MDHPRQVTRLAFISLGIFLFFILTRVIGLGKFVAVDEPAWFLFASNFFVALSKGQFENTVYDYHPAVTTLWILTLAFLSYFPGYRLVGKLTDKYWQVDALFQKYHKLPLRVLLHGRVISILALGGLLVVSFLLLNLLVGLGSALIVLGMIMLDPFILGHSRLLNHETMMAVFILIALFSALVYLYPRRRWGYLLLSGAAAGAALLTKSPALVLLPLIGLVFLVRFIDEARSSSRKGRLLAGYAAAFLAWLGMICLVYFVFWPGMWVAPGKMLYAVFGNALSYGLQGGRLSVTQELKPANFALDFAGVGHYLKVVVLKTTPIVWLGVLLAFIGIWGKRGRWMSSLARLVVIYSALLALIFTLLFGIAQGRDHNHYVLTSFAALDVIAGIGFVWGYGWLREKAPFFQKRWVATALFIAVLGLHAAGGIPQYPYYYTYTNPLAQVLMPGYQDPDAGYGEGLELAGAYLAAKPDAANLKAMSWYAAGPFSYYFPGTTYNLLISDKVDKSYVERMKLSDYLVIYSVQQKAVDMPAKLLKALQAYTPEKVIWLNGREYIQIYNVKDFDEAFFAAIQG